MAAWVWFLLLVAGTGVAFNPHILHRPSPTPLFAEKQSLVVSLPPNVKSQRVDAYLATAAEGDTSRSAFGQLCERGKVVINDKVGKKNTKVSSGDRIDFEVEEKPESSVRSEQIPLDILYEDRHLIVVNKPAGMVVHPAPGSPNGTFVNALLYHLGDEAAEKLLENVGNADEMISEIDENLDLHDDDDGKDDNFEDCVEEYEDDVYNGPVEGDKPVSLDLPETPEAANASPQSLRPGIVHRLDKGERKVL